MRFNVGDVVIYNGTWMKGHKGKVIELAPDAISKYRIDWEDNNKEDIPEWQTGKYLMKA